MLPGDSFNNSVYSVIWGDISQLRLERNTTDRIHKLTRTDRTDRTGRTDRKDRTDRKNMIDI